MIYENLIGSSDSLNSLPTIKMNFSISSDPIEVTDIAEQINFSENPVGAINEYFTTCFSLIERIKLASKSPREVLRTRLKEVIRYCKANDISTIKLNRQLIVRYLSEYVYQIIIDSISDPSITNINLIMILGLQELLEDNDLAAKLQEVLRKAKLELESSGSLSKATQNSLSKSYSKFWINLLHTIEEKYLPENKKGSLVHREKGLILK